MKNFRPITEFDGYLVSNCGTIFSQITNKILKPGDSLGYLQVSLSLGGKCYSKKVHLLVARYFIGQKPAGTVCAHLDGNSKNNHVSNLAYVTQKENISHKKSHGTYTWGDSHCRSKITSAIAKKIIRDYVRTSYHKSNAIALAKKFKISKSMVVNIAKRRNWKGLK